MEELFLEANNITEIEGLENLINLEILCLDSNKITEIKGLDSLINLKSLSLSFNEINEIKGLDNLHNLVKLNLEGNDIRDIKYLYNFPNLKYVSLSFNPLSIPQVEDLQDHNDKLRIWFTVNGGRNWNTYFKLRLEELKIAVQNLDKSFLTGVISKEKYKKMKNSMTNRINLILSEIETYKNSYKKI